MKTIYIKNIKPNWNMLKHHVGKDYIKYSLNMYDILKFNNKSNYLITSNIKNNELSNLKLSYQNLKIDLINNNIPTRSRKYCNYRLDVRNKNEFKLGIVDSDIFVQNTNDNRNIPRKFQLIDKEIILSNWLTDYIGNIAALALLNKNDSKIKYCNVYIVYIDYSDDSYDYLWILMMILMILVIIYCYYYYCIYCDYL